MTAAAPGQTLAFVRMTIDPGGFISAHGHPGAQIWYVESGAFSTTMLEGTMQITRAADDGTPVPAEQLAAGAETTLSAGDSAFFDADVSHTVHPAGDEPTVVLIPALFETRPSWAGQCRCALRACAWRAIQTWCVG